MKRSQTASHKINLEEFTWINQPAKFTLSNNSLKIETEPETDLWQRTYYGFRNDNAPGFLKHLEGDFTFVVKTNFETKSLFDQCGILLYQDCENWVKASVEYENEKIARLGSVVTNLGYSDWATCDIPASVTEMWYRFSRRGQDFYIEFSINGETYKQMRVLHMHLPIAIAKVGVYACSPVKSNFIATFSDFNIGSCQWQPHN